MPFGTQTKVQRSRRQIKVTKITGKQVGDENIQGKSERGRHNKKQLKGGDQKLLSCKYGGRETKAENKRR